MPASFPAVEPSADTARASGSGTDTTTQPLHRPAIVFDMPAPMEATDTILTKSTSSFGSNGMVVHKVSKGSSQQGDNTEHVYVSTTMPEVSNGQSLVDKPTSTMPAIQSRNQSSTPLQQQSSGQPSSHLKPQANSPSGQPAMTRPIMPLRVKQKPASQNTTATAPAPTLEDLWSTLQSIVRDICEQQPSYRSVSKSAVNCMRDIILQHPMPAAFTSDNSEAWASAMKQETDDIAHEMLVSQDWQGTSSDANLAAENIVKDMKDDMDRYIACYHTLLADASLKLILEKVGGLLRFISLPESIIEEYLLNFVHYKIQARLLIMDESPARSALARLDSIYEGEMIPLLLLDALRYDEAATYGIDALNRSFDTFEDEFFLTVFDPAVAMPKDRVEAAIQALKFSRSKYSVYLRAIATNALTTFHGAPSSRSTSPVKAALTTATCTPAPKKSSMVPPRQAVPTTTSTTSALPARANTLRKSTSKADLSGRTSPMKQVLRSRASWVAQQPLRPASTIPGNQSTTSSFPAVAPASTTSGIPSIIRAHGPPFCPRKRTTSGQSLTTIAKSVKDKVSGVLNKGREPAVRKRKSVAFGRAI